MSFVTVEYGEVSSEAINQLTISWSIIHLKRNVYVLCALKLNIVKRTVAETSATVSFTL